MICEADGRVVTREMLLRKIWGQPRNALNAVKSRTIDQHISRIRRSLSKVPIITAVPGRGYKLIRY
jgi:DNA-binding response OmpR family regulator